MDKQSADEGAFPAQPPTATTLSRSVVAKSHNCSLVQPAEGRRLSPSSHEGVECPAIVMSGAMCPVT